MKRYRWLATDGVLLILNVLVSIPNDVVHAQAEIWTRQFGTNADDLVFQVAVEGAGNLYAAGGTKGALAGQTHLGFRDAFLRKYDSLGNEVWTHQFGTKGTRHLLRCSQGGRAV